MKLLPKETKKPLIYNIYNGETTQTRELSTGTKKPTKKNSTVHSGPAEMSPSQCSRLEAVLGSAGAPPQCQIPVRLSELVEGADGVGQEGDQAAVQASPVLPLRALVLKHTQRMGS